MNRNAQLVLEHRYLQKDAAGRVIETPDQMFERVAAALADAEVPHVGEHEARRLERRFADVMRRGLFLPNSPTLMNAGTAVGQLAACFVLPVEDSIPGIFGAVRDAARIHQSGGGTGFDFSRLRPRGDRVQETGGVASGPVSFMRVFDTATEVVKQGGRRRGANMGVLGISHPDVLEFVRAKHDPGVLSNFNLSVSVTDGFLRAAAAGGEWPLVNPRDGAVVARVDARELWQSLAAAAWRGGDPGVLFADAIERANPTPELGALTCTNPCGEQPLLPWEACTLGSINLSKCAGAGGFDWTALDATARLGVRLLEAVLDANRWPLPEIERAAHATRKIGLGVMGLADAFVKLRVPYASDAAVRLAGRIMEHVRRAADGESARLAAERGPFPAWEGSALQHRGGPPMRHATRTTVAPTGTLSILAGCSSGIEPLFAVAYVRRVLDGSELPEVHPEFVAELERRGIAVEPTLERVIESGGVSRVTELPEDLRERFQTALDVAPEWHVYMQAEVQRHTDNAVSKTVHLPEDATVEDVRHVFERAWRMECKGITVFRTGCRPESVLHAGRVPAFAIAEARARADAEYAGDCRVCSV